MQITLRLAPPQVPLLPSLWRIMWRAKMAALRAAVPVLALLGLCLGPAAAVTPLVIWHGMGEPGPSASCLGAEQHRGALAAVSPSSAPPVSAGPGGC